MSAGRGRILLIMLVAVVALAVGETFLSKGMKQAGRSGGGWTDQAVAVVRNGWILAGFALLLIHVGLYMLALRGADLSFALPSPRPPTHWPRSWRDFICMKTSARCAGSGRS